MHLFEVELINRKLNWELILVFGLSAADLGLIGGPVVKTKTGGRPLEERPTLDEPDKLSVALDLLRKILTDVTNRAIFLV